MARPEKVEQVRLLSEKLQSARTAVLTDYRGLSVSQMEDLRGRFRGANVEYRVIKNTLARLAVSESGQTESLQELFVGPVAIAFGYEELGTPIRVINEFARQARLRLDIKGGVVEGQVLDAAQMREIGDLPSREVLLAQLLGTLESPISQLANAMQASVRELVGLLEARKDQLGGGEAAA